MHLDRDITSLFFSLSLPHTQLTEMTLRLFDTLFRRHNQHAVQNLVLRDFPPHVFPAPTDDVYEVREIMNAYVVYPSYPPACFSVYC